jgi:serine/threonine-protein kinase
LDLACEGVVVVGAGTMLAGRYLLEERIAKGGMGEVWRSFDRVLGRTVAVKRLLAALPEEPRFVDRFWAEARTMATISHPGVVEVYDFGDDPAAGLYLVMKFIDGESLAHTLIRFGRLSVEMTMRLVAEAAEALHAAHERGVTHRDVKPGNLLLRPDGSALLTDFGIARSPAATGHTTTGSLAGTAGYIAPERVNGQLATPQSDIYSLGVVAYRCLAGHLPFTGESMVEVAMRHVHDEPPPLPADVPPSVRAVVERAMAKDPAARWPSGAVLAVMARQALTLVAPKHQAVPAFASRQDHVAPQTASPRGQGAASTVAGRHRAAWATDSPDEENTATTVSPQDQAVVGSASSHDQAMVPMPAGEQPVPGGRARRLAIPAAVLVVAITATVAILLTRGGGLQSRSLPGNPDASGAGHAAAATPTGMSPGATISVPGSNVASSAVPSPPKPKPGGGSAAPAAPKNLTATAISANTIRLQWTDVSADEEGFTVIDAITSRNVGANTTMFDWTGLPAATYSCFKVRAFSSAGESAFSDWACTTSQDGTGPAPPQNLTAIALNANTVRLRWSDNSPDETGFTVTDGATSRNVGAGVEVYDWLDLAPGTYKCFMVRSFKPSGVSPYSGWACVTTPNAG